jgi:hypothetical protein
VGVGELLERFGLAEAADRVARGRVAAEGTPNELMDQLRGGAVQVELSDPEATAGPTPPSTGCRASGR